MAARNAFLGFTIFGLVKGHSQGKAHIEGMETSLSLICSIRPIQAQPKPRSEDMGPSSKAPSRLVSGAARGGHCFCFEGTCVDMDQLGFIQS